MSRTYKNREYWYNNPPTWLRKKLNRKYRREKKRALLVDDWDLVTVPVYFKDRGWYW